MRLDCLLVLAASWTGFYVVVGESSSSADVMSRPLILEFEHSMDGETFTPRSKFTVNVTPNAEIKYTVMEAERNGIYEGASEGFKALLRSNAFYRIRVRSIADDESSAYVSAALPACALQKSGFKEDLTVFVGPNRNIVGLSYSSPVIALSRSCDPNKLAVPTLLMTRLKVTEGETSMALPITAEGPKPHTLYHVDLGAYKDDNLKTVDKTQQAQGSQSFLRRYWWIVIILIYFFMRDDGPAEPATKGDAAAGGDKTKAVKAE